MDFIADSSCVFFILLPTIRISSLLSQFCINTPDITISLIAPAEFNLFGISLFFTGVAFVKNVCSCSIYGNFSFKVHAKTFFRLDIDRPWVDFLFLPCF